MQEAIIVLNAGSRVVDLNPAAQRLINHDTSKVIGQPLTRVFATWPGLVEHCCFPGEVDDVVIVYDSSKPRHFELRATPLYRKNKQQTMTGRLRVLRDITERIQVGLSEAVQASLDDAVKMINSFAYEPIKCLIWSAMTNLERGSIQRLNCWLLSRQLLLACVFFNGNCLTSNTI